MIQDLQYVLVQFRPLSLPTIQRLFKTFKINIFNLLLYYCFIKLLAGLVQEYY